jgi:hypothetical protein
VLLDKLDHVLMPEAAKPFHVAFRDVALSGDQLQPCAQGVIESATLLELFLVHDRLPLLPL